MPPPSAINGLPNLILPLPQSGEQKLDDNIIYDIGRYYLDDPRDVSALRRTNKYFYDKLRRALFLADVERMLHWTEYDGSERRQSGPPTTLLGLAAETDNMKDAIYAMATAYEKNFDLYIDMPFDKPPILLAILKNQTRMVEYLLQRGCKHNILVSINIPSGTLLDRMAEVYPLRELRVNLAAAAAAAQQGNDSRIVQLVAQAMGRPKMNDVADNIQLACWLVCALRGEIETIKMLGTSPNNAIRRFRVHDTASNALHMAALTNDNADMIQYLTRTRGVHRIMQQRDMLNYTPLMLAASRGSFANCMALVNAGSPFIDATPHGMTALDLLVQDDKFLPIIKTLHARMTQETFTKSGEEMEPAFSKALITAMSRQDKAFETVRYLVGVGISLRWKLEPQWECRQRLWNNLDGQEIFLQTGSTALHAAASAALPAQYRRKEVLDFLLYPSLARAQTEALALGTKDSAGKRPIEVTNDDDTILALLRAGTDPHDLPMALKTQIYLLCKRRGVKSPYKPVYSTELPPHYREHEEELEKQKKQKKRKLPA